MKRLEQAITNKLSSLNLFLIKVADFTRKYFWFFLAFVLLSIVTIHLGYRLRHEALRVVFQCCYLISLTGITLTLGYSYKKFIHPLIWLPLFIWMIIFFIEYRSFAWMQFFLYLFLLDWKSHWLYRLISHLMFAFCMFILCFSIIFQDLGFTSLEYSFESPNAYRRIDVYHSDQGALGFDMYIKLVDTYGIFELIQTFPIDDTTKQSDIHWVDENTIQIKDKRLNLKKY